MHCICELQDAQQNMSLSDACTKVGARGPEWLTVQRKRPHCPPAPLCNAATLIAAKVLRLDLKSAAEVEVEGPMLAQGRRIARVAARHAHRLHPGPVPANDCGVLLATGVEGVGPRLGRAGAQALI